LPPPSPWARPRPPSPAPGLLLQERAVIVDNGKALRTITVLPAGVMVTAVHIKI
jgi:hypothetical protein